MTKSIVLAVACATLVMSQVAFAGMKEKREEFKKQLAPNELAVVQKMEDNRRQFEESLTPEEKDALKSIHKKRMEGNGNVGAAGMVPPAATI
jgi:hypothetical protein